MTKILFFFLLVYSAYSFSYDDVLIDKIILRLETQNQKLIAKENKLQQKKINLERFINPNIPTQKKINLLRFQIGVVEKKMHILNENKDFYLKMKKFLAIDLSHHDGRKMARDNFQDWYQHYLFFKTFFSYNKNFLGKEKEIRDLSQNDFFKKTQKILKNKTINYLRFKKITRILFDQKLEDEREMNLSFNCEVIWFEPGEYAKPVNMIDSVNIKVNSESEKFIVLYDVFRKVHKAKSDVRGGWSLNSKKYKDVQEFLDTLESGKYLFPEIERNKMDVFIAGIRKSYPVRNLNDQNYCQILMKTYF